MRANVRTLTGHLLLGLIWLLPVGSHGSTPAAGESDDEPSEIARLNSLGIAAQHRRCLGEASGFFDKVLEREPPATPSDLQRQLVLRFAPRLLTVDGEYFPLKDVVAIIHPDKPIVGYHLFWEDDIGYPADNEPCDHEVVWIEFDPASLRVIRVSAYFHGQILSPTEAAAEANANGGHAWIGVEWGFHGSLPWQALTDAPGTPRARLFEHWERAHAADTQTAGHPLARGWPKRFAGSFTDYLEFSIAIDPTVHLTEHDLIRVSRWPTATIDRHALRYNFAAKTEWPWQFQP